MDYSVHLAREVQCKHLSRQERGTHGHPQRPGGSIPMSRRPRHARQAKVSEQLHDITSECPNLPRVGLDAYGFNRETCSFSRRPYIFFPLRNILLYTFRRGKDHHLSMCIDVVHITLDDATSPLWPGGDPSIDHSTSDSKLESSDVESPPLKNGRQKGRMEFIPTQDAPTIFYYIVLL